MAGDTLLPLSVVVIARNEERRIGDCLRSVHTLADDIIVVDSQSTDATAEIAGEIGARVFVRRWPGYSEQKNFGCLAAAYDWILSLDADERVSAELAMSIRREFARSLRCDVYDLRFANHFAARRVRFGAWNPEWHARLFDRRIFHWNTDDVHEGLCGIEPFRRGRLQGPILHFPVESHAQLVVKTERYASLFAMKLRRQNREPRWTKVWLNPAWRFFRDYFLRLGVFDGFAGLAIAWEGGRYTFLKYRLAQERSKRAPARQWYAFAAVTAAAILVLAPLVVDQLKRQDATAPMTTAVPLTGRLPAHGLSSPSSDPTDDSNSSMDTLQDDDILV